MNYSTIRDNYSNGPVGDYLKQNITPEAADCYINDRMARALTPGAIAELFGVRIPAVSKHLANNYEEGELDREATVSKMETVQDDAVIIPFWSLPHLEVVSL